MAASTIATHQPYKEGFSVNAYNAAWDGCEIAVAAVAGKSHYIEYIFINNVTNTTTVSIGSGEDPAGTIETVLIGPIATSANMNIEMHFAKPIKVAAGKDINVDTSAATAALVVLQGFTE